jgi:spore coat polysaccharide biosynthesis protein SpsF (cytidylyltransferase family)
MIGVFITARLGSTRLSEKHLIEVNEKPFIKWLVERFSTAFKENIEKNELKIFITTSIKTENMKFESLFDKSEVEVFYGSDENIPLRHLECAVENNIDHIISIDGDDILCSTEASKVVADRLLDGSKMVQTTGLPLGMNSTGYSKVFLEYSLKGIESNKLETGWGKIFEKNEIDVIQMKKDENIEKIRMTLDYEPDADFFKKVISNIDVLNVSDDMLIESIVTNNWNQINGHLDDIYWSNFNKQKQEEN